MYSSPTLRPPVRRLAAIRDDEFAMVAEIELEAIAPAARGLEALDPDAAVAQDAEPFRRELVAAHFIVEEIDFHPGARAADEVLLELHAERVVVDDEELDEEVFARGIDGGEDGIEGGVAIDEQFDVIAAGRGKGGQELAPAVQDVDGIGFRGEGLRRRPWPRSAAEWSGPLVSVMAQR